MPPSCFLLPSRPKCIPVLQCTLLFICHALPAAKRASTNAIFPASFGSIEYRSRAASDPKNLPASLTNLATFTISSPTSGVASCSEGDRSFRWRICISTLCSNEWMTNPTASVGSCALLPFVSIVLALHRANELLHITIVIVIQIGIIIVVHPLQHRHLQVLRLRIRARLS